MNNEIVNAMEELENWLADPSELGRKPAKIEYTASFEDEDGIKCMIFKFKKSFFGKWLLGIVSESGTFSEMKEYNSSTETEDAKALLHILKEYWKKMAEKEQGFIEIPIENLIEWTSRMGKVVSFPIRSQKKATKSATCSEKSQQKGIRTVAGDSWLVMKMTNIWTIRIIIMSLHSTPSAITTAILSLIFMPKSDLLSYV